MFIHLLSFLAIISTAQNFTLKLFGIKDGLPGSQVIYVMQDDRGYLWISTEGGLSSYNGSIFKNYNISNGLPANNVAFGSEDPMGRIWGGNKDHICVFDGSRFITYPIENPPANIGQRQPFHLWRMVTRN